MKLMKHLEPKRFNYQPRYYEPGSKEKGRIRFQRITRYDPHIYTRGPWVCVVLALVIGIIIYFSGGFRASTEIPSISHEDAVFTLAGDTQN